MRFSYVAIASLFASVAYSQTIGSEVAQIPSCALSCLTAAISKAGCGLTDYACQCGSAKNTITSDATPCVASSCSTSDILKVQSVTTQICVIQAASGGGSSSGGSGASSSTTAAPATTATTSAVSAIGSFPATTATTAAGASTSTPAQVTTSSGDKVRVGGALAGAAAALFALVL